MCQDTKYYQCPISDRDTAIKNMGGMVWLYEKHLTKFKNTYADSSMQALDYLVQGNADEARLLIHSVKGLAGTLGLRQLYYAAADLESAIIASKSQLSEELSVYESCLMKVLQLP